jgi:hypothetical protein
MCENIIVKALTLTLSSKSEPSWTIFTMLAIDSTFNDPIPISIPISEKRPAVVDTTPNEPTSGPLQKKRHGRPPLSDEVQAQRVGNAPSID